MKKKENKQSMFRFYYVVFTSLFFAPMMAIKAKHYLKHPEKYDKIKCYRLAQKIMDYMRRRGHATTDYFGLDNLPKEGGYILYSNHQGKYDAIGILLAHDEPCAILMEKVMSEKIMSKQVIDLVFGKRLDFTQPRQQLQALKEIGEEVKAGKKYLIFPEGKWGDNENVLQEFNTGCFRCSIDSQTPIVPVCIVDSYKALSGRSLKKVVTQVHYLDPIPYEEYKDMKKTEISNMVKRRIQDKMDDVLSKRN